MEAIDKAWNASSQYPSTSDLLSNAEENEISTIVLPSKFIKCSRTDLAILISRMLTFLIQINDSSSKSSDCDVSALTRFHSRIPPDISVFNYLIRLTKYSSLEHCVLLTAVYYIDLLSSVYPTFTLNSLTVHRFLLTATTVASKGLVDSFCTNTHYAKVGGVHCSELNLLECEFLKKINYRIIPRDENIDHCKLEKKHDIFSLQKGSDKDLINSLKIKNNFPENESSYNVLNTYYNKIVQLVGSFESSPDKSKVINYTLPYFIRNIHTEDIVDKPQLINIHPFKEAIQDVSGISRKRNLDATVVEDLDMVSDQNEKGYNDKTMDNETVDSESSVSKKHINQQRLPKISHRTEH
ncbi:hypothetical protein HG535_0G02890 [Zygotorulaspora mrakii]|uniref:Cyclin-like domain-containing protein n=1 Tax=Zygotorulaspora mrakii TaxID=42260 RepID=A0A7H9B7R3_ZYGMR|nr:uncharacterized protein HG535_0G02890 [Zygotorulaspora mrakii]QLG74406.1 hypothetical protein HG535_0G02890 [Zygotorulaspora mrakii]